MFGKSKPPDSASSLASRVRQIADRVPTSETSTEKRIARSKQRAPRQPVFRDATILMANGERLAVAVKEVSASGARIEFVRRVPLPDVFLLSEPTLKLRRRARVVWQREGIAGVMFVD
jgi:hypothetical protein